MKKLKMLFLAGLATVFIGVFSMTAFAATYNTPAEAVAAITGRTVESVTAEKVQTGKTYGTIAQEAGKLAAFQVAIFEMQKANLADQVAKGTITQERADFILATLQAAQTTCNGTGTARVGQTTGAKFGSNGTGQGNGGANRGNGTGRGANGNGGRGMGAGRK